MKEYVKLNVPLLYYPQMYTLLLLLLLFIVCLFVSFFSQEKECYIMLFPPEQVERHRDRF